MKITWLGHACFKIEGQNVTLITDPYDASVGYPQRPMQSDYVTISHEHHDHNDASWIDGAQIIRSLGEQHFPGLAITGLPSFHDALRGRQRGENRIYKFEIDGITFCHLGDLGEPLSEHLWRCIGRIDVLLVPVGGSYTIDAAVAKQTVDWLEPYLTIAMHFGTSVCSIHLEDVDSFLQLTHGEKIGENMISFDRETLIKNHRVIALHYLH